MKIRAFGQVLVAATLVGLNLTACGPSKVAQCTALSSEINKAAGLGKKFEAVGKDLEEEGSKIKKIEEFHAMAKKGSEKVTVLVNELDGFIGKVKGVELKDEKLVASRDKAVTLYTGASKSLKDVGEVLGQFTKMEANEAGKKMLEASTKKLETAMKDLQTVDKEEQAVAKEFNTYCGVEKK
jgi:uncharacterized coiled-coil DUF342 family protein